jgi:predicted transcriptional regulator
MPFFASRNHAKLGTMNKAAESILDRIADWPKEAQEELMQSIVDIEARHLGVYRLSDDERAAVRKGMAQADRGEFVPDNVIEDYFNKHRA